MIPTDLQSPAPSSTASAAGRSLSFAVPLRPQPAGALDLPAVEAAFRLAETLGYRRGWLVHDGTAVAVLAVLAALSRATGDLDLVAATPVEGWTSPVTVATVLATADALAPGRIHAAVTAAPARPDGGPAAGGEFLGLPGPYHRTAARLLQVRQRLAAVAPASGRADDGPHRRLWFPAADVAAARWAAAHGLNLACFPAVGQGASASHQHAVVRAYRDATASGRVGVTRVLLPLDSADAPTRNAHLARAERDPGVLAASSCALVERLAADRAVRDADELVVALPPDLTPAAQAQVLHDVAVYVAPELGVESCSDDEDGPAGRAA